MQLSGSSLLLWEIYGKSPIIGDLLPLWNKCSNKTKFTWTKKCQHSFLVLNQQLMPSFILAYLILQLPFLLDTDTSDIGIIIDNANTLSCRLPTVEAEPQVDSVRVQPEGAATISRRVRLEWTKPQRLGNLVCNTAGRCWSWETNRWKETNSEEFPEKGQSLSHLKYQVLNIKQGLLVWQLPESV